MRGDIIAYGKGLIYSSEQSYQLTLLQLER